MPVIALARPARQFCPELQAINKIAGACNQLDLQLQELLAAIVGLMPAVAGYG